ncbi:unnamed protein product [Cuscuta epithymum]|uniref:Homeobox domain-containing protein n=1 Tax=Cuscuta epithymum TaxID=186058 RepID=A0AAV0C713_9ASTE|nr:unnamed protein product [Cuscuta epithymum]
MEWVKHHQAAQLPPPPVEEVGGGMFVKVMTDEQMEVLRKQIAVYATISEQLVDLHKSITSQHDLPGARLGSFYCDQLVTSAGHKITGRQRWTPTPVQLQILERMFDQGNGTPSKQKIKEIASELSQHGQISETNVYNWFQNRRARSKRKQQVASTNNTESEVEAEVQSANDHSQSKPKDDLETLKTENVCYQTLVASSAMKSINSRSNEAEPVFPSQSSTSKPAGSFGHMSFCGLSNPRMEQMIGRIDVPGSYNPYLNTEDYNLMG